MITVDRQHLKAPRRLREMLRSLGGVNPRGDPNFRVVWGWDRFTWIGGRFYDRDGSDNIIRISIGERRLPKYLPPDRWYLEVWMPPEAYGSPEEWAAQTIEIIDGVIVRTLGPYPNHGEYELVKEIIGPNGEYIPLTPTVCEALISAVNASRNIPGAIKRLANEERMKREAASRERVIIDRIENTNPNTHAKERRP